jgi:replicative DNA helicase
MAELVGASGFRVLSLNEATWKFERRTVSKVFVTGRKQLFALRTGLGRGIRATANHRFLTIEGWRRLDEIAVGQHIALPREMPAATNSSMTDDELALLGHLIGDGCTLPRHAIQYTTADRALGEIVMTLATRVFGGRIKPRLRPERSWFQVYLPSASGLTHGKRNPVAAWLDELAVFGLRSHEKLIPDRVFQQPARQIGLFLRHLWSTDGCLHVGNKATPLPRIYYASSSRILAVGVQSLLLRLGITARVTICAQPGKGRDQHHVTISGRPDIRRFLAAVGGLRPSALVAQESMLEWASQGSGNTNRDVIPAEIWEREALPALAASGLTHRQLHAALGTRYNGSSLYRQNLGRERTERIATALGSERLAQLAQSDVYWDRVIAVSADGEEDVYDMSVDELHNFVANDVVVHNSIEQDADVVMFLFRPGMHKEDIDKSQTELIVAKNRNGPTKDINLVFVAAQTMFKEPVNYPNEPG